MRANYAVGRQRLGVLTVIMGEMVGSIIAIVFYFTVLIPFGLGSRLFSDPLRRKVDSSEYWLDRPPVPTHVDSARKLG